MINIMNLCLALPTELGIHHVHDNNITYCNLEKVVIDIVRWCFSDALVFSKDFHEVKTFYLSLFVNICFCFATYSHDVDKVFPFKKHA